MGGGQSSVKAKAHAGGLARTTTGASNPSPRDAPAQRASSSPRENAAVVHKTGAGKPIPRHAPAARASSDPRGIEAVVQKTGAGKASPRDDPPTCASSSPSEAATVCLSTSASMHRSPARCWFCRGHESTCSLSRARELRANQLGRQSRPSSHLSLCSAHPELLAPALHAP
jgi:hypothetical protein